MQIKAENVNYIFNPKSPFEFQALNGISVKINQGEYVGIIGQTGSGKTTFIEHLNGLLVPSDGSVDWIYEDDVYDKKSKTTSKQIIKFTITNKNKRKFKPAKKIRRKVGVVFQFAEYQLFKATVEEDIIFGPVSYGMPLEEAKAKAKEYIELVGLPTSYLKRSPFDLSGGQKRRVALAGILAMEPDFLVVDEPTAGLDPTGVREILDILSNLHKKGKTIVNVTHDLDNVLERAKRVLVFKNGKVVKDGDPYTILNNVDFLKENALQPPKLLEFVDKLRNLNVAVPRVTSNEELIDWLNKYLKGKRNKNGGK